MTEDILTVAKFVESELDPIPSGQPLARWGTVMTLHRRYVELGGKLSRPSFTRELELQLPDVTFTDLGRQGRKIPYRLKSNDEAAPVVAWFDAHCKKVEPLGRGVPHGVTAERKQSDWATVTELHASYTDYCLSTGTPPLGLVRFGRTLAQHLGATYPLYRFGASRLPCVLVRSEPSDQG